MPPIPIQERTLDIPSGAGVSTSQPLLPIGQGDPVGKAAVQTAKSAVSVAGNITSITQEARTRNREHHKQEVEMFNEETKLEYDRKTREARNNLKVAKGTHALTAWGSYQLELKNIKRWLDDRLSGIGDAAGVRYPSRGLNINDKQYVRDNIAGIQNDHVNTLSLHVAGQHEVALSEVATDMNQNNMQRIADDNMTLSASISNNASYYKRTGKPDRDPEKLQHAQNLAVMYVRTQIRKGGTHNKIVRDQLKAGEFQEMSIKSDLTGESNVHELIQDQNVINKLIDESIKKEKDDKALAKADAKETSRLEKEAILKSDNKIKNNTLDRMDAGENVSLEDIANIQDADERQKYRKIRFNQESYSTTDGAFYNETKQKLLNGMDPTTVSPIKDKLSISDAKALRKEFENKTPKQKSMDKALGSFIGSIKREIEQGSALKAARPLRIKKAQIAQQHIISLWEGAKTDEEKFGLITAGSGTYIHDQMIATYSVTNQELTDDMNRQRSINTKPKTIQEALVGKPIGKDEIEEAKRQLKQRGKIITNESVWNAVGILRREKFNEERDK